MILHKKRGGEGCMYYQNYEDYMRTVLGYPIESMDTYPMNFLEENRDYSMVYQDRNELEECYPEIHKMLYPMICEVCDRCSKPITKDMIDNMVEEVYQRVENNHEIAIRINIENRNEPVEAENRNTNNNAKANMIRTNGMNEANKRVQEVENRQRRLQNPFLRDLIRILILNRILGGNFPHRPPRPRPPMRPPFPGGPRPPMKPQPRDYDDYFKF